MTVTRSVHDNIVVLTLNNPPVNALSYPLRVEFSRLLTEAMEDPRIGAVVFAGSPHLFSGGAEISEFGTPVAFRTPNLKSLIAQFDEAPKPIIAAIEGAVLGGGLELSLACHYRVGSPRTSVAFPEIHLGIIPGAEGSQRLPRLVGVETALNMMLSGNPVPASALAHTKLFDKIVEGDFMSGVLAFAAGVAAKKEPPPRVRDIRIKEPGTDAFLGFARNMVKPMAKHVDAPLRLIDAVEAAIKLPFTQSAAKELDIFRALLDTPQSRAMRHAFFSERQASRIEGLSRDVKPRPFNKVAVVGAGTMGSGIAINFLNAGLPVVLIETAQEALDRGTQHIRKTYEGDLKRGRITEAKLQQRMALLQPSLTLMDAADCDLAIEAVFEDMGVKSTVLAKLDAVLKPGAILASNTSTLDLDKLANATGRPQDVIGLHFFSPANIMKLLEIVRGEKTADDVLATAMAIAKTIRKTPVLSRVCDGFIGNRMINYYFEQSLLLIEEGALPEQVDRALEAWGMAMGPFRMSDMSGNDIGWAIRKRQYTESPNRHRAIIADRLCEQGRFGQKTGKGWYRYQTGARAGMPDADVKALIETYRAEAGITPRKISDDEIMRRCIFALANEGARLLEEGIAQRASDVDVVYLTGYGFPTHRGGPLHYLEEFGLNDAIRYMKGFAHRGGPDAQFWAPAPLLTKAAQNGTSIAATLAASHSGART